MRATARRFGHGGPVRIAAGLALLACVASLRAADLPVYRDGVPVLEVAVPSDAGADLRETLQDFWRVVRKMGGVCVPVRFGDARSGLPSLRLSLDPSLAGTLEEGQGFVLDVGPSGGSLRAADEAGLRDGLYWILGYEGGVRWFWPGEVGEDVPARASWSLPAGRRTVAPAYLSRTLWLVGTGAEWELWSRRNLLRDRYRHEHNLHRIFPPALAVAEPELFGANARSLDAHFWQPDLGSSTAVEHAAVTAARFLQLNSDVEGLSLSINDSMRFDTGPATAERVQPLRWFRGRPDYSPLVFGFANEVARRVDAGALGGRLLGAYAYYWAENAPPFAVEPAVLPVLTADRFQYYDRSFEENDADLMRRWGASGARRLMLYEYLYGDAYVVPRQASPAIARSIRNGRAAGARGYFAEVRTIPGLDGPKPWIVARLLWDTALDVRALEAEFAARMFGAEAAPAYLRWLAAAEAAWSSQQGAARWLRGYHDDQQGALLDDAAVAALRGAVAELGERTGAPGGGAASQRAAVVSRAWELSEAAVALQRSRVDVGDAAALAWRGGDPERARARSLAAAHLGRERAALQVAHDLAVRGELVAEPRWLVRSSPVTRALAAAEGWEDEPDASLGENPTLERRRAPSETERHRNTWFRQEVEVLPAGWTFDNRSAEGLRLASPADERGGWSLRAADGARLVQLVPVTPGVRYRAAARARGTVSFGVDAGLRLVFLDRSRRQVGEAVQIDRLEIGVHDEWRRLVVDGEAPAGAVWAELSFQVAGQAPCAEGTESAESVEVGRIGLWYAPVDGPGK